jgi:DNA-binding NarL/FixJ family response regulator
MEARGTELMPAQLRVLLVDSREERRKLMVDVVEGDGGRARVIAEADSLDAAQAAVHEEGPDAVLVDLRMPTVEGLRTVQHLRRVFPQLGIVVCSFDLSAMTVQEALLAGADVCLRKPASPYELAGALDAARRRASTAVAPVASS